MIGLPTHAITLHGPWLWAILHLGKDIENRSAGFPRCSGWYWLHASKAQSPTQTRQDLERVEYMGRRAGRWLDNPPTIEHLLSLRGQICGAVEVLGRVTSSRSLWFVGPTGLQLGRRFALPTPVPAVGSLGVWQAPKVDVPTEFVERLQRGGIVDG